MPQKLTGTEGRYLKLIYRRQVEERKLEPQIWPKSFDVRPATVTERLQKLARKTF
jgi:Mn-dependent DtxR family transcriptional regulator